MNKLDLSEKISLTDLINALIKKGESPYCLLKNELRIKKDWQVNYFNWGRNALYYLFKSLPYKTITFPGFTCPTLVESAERAGKKVLLTEIDLNTFNLDISKIPLKTECLIAVHTFGCPVDIKRIRRKHPQIFIIEDCAHALFSKINNGFMGNQGDAVLFSLYKQVPNINGCLLLSKERLIEKQNQESNFKHLKRLIFKTKGLHQYLLDFKKKQYLPLIKIEKLNNYQPSNLAFNLFENNFKSLEKEVEKRRLVAKWYYQESKKSKFILPQKPEKDSQTSYYHFAVRLIPEIAGIREKVVLDLRKKNIFIDRLWYKAPIVQSKYKKEQKNCPKALLLAETVINLPIYSHYKRDDVKCLFNQLNQAIKQND